MAMFITSIAAVREKTKNNIDGWRRFCAHFGRDPEAPATPDDEEQICLSKVELLQFGMDEEFRSLVSSVNDMTGRTTDVDHTEVDGDEQPHVRVEYDPEFAGGDYNGVGSYVLIPLSDIDARGGGDDAVQEAFSAQTNLPADCIIHFTQDELYDKSGRMMVHDAVAADEDAPSP